MAMNILAEGQRVLRAEAAAIAACSRRLDRSFTDALTLLSQVKGKIIISGIGKSGLIARRMASVFSSTGTPAFFMHPTESLHGDIGMISDTDAVILISHSGRSSELNSIIPFIKRRGVKIISMTRDKESPLSKFSDVTLETRVYKEACPFNLVPSISSAVTTSLGDSLAITLMKMKGFKHQDYKNVHPGGEIGRRLLFRVQDLMQSEDKIPVTSENDSLDIAIRIMSAKKLGMTCVVNSRGALAGILTDGDLRRLLEKKKADLSAPVKSLKIAQPKTVVPSLLAVEALSLMEKHSITSLIVVNNPRQKKITGVIHMHNILKAGVV